MVCRVYPRIHCAIIITATTHPSESDRYITPIEAHTTEVSRACPADTGPGMGQGALLTQGGGLGWVDCPTGLNAGWLNDRAMAPISWSRSHELY